MSTISPSTRAAIKQTLEKFIKDLVEDHRKRKIPTVDDPASYLTQVSSEGGLKPFHAAMMQPDLLRISGFERSFSTRLGKTYEECARLIARQQHKKVHREYDVTGMVSVAALNEIERQVAVFEHATEPNQPRPLLTTMINAVLNARKSDDLRRKTIRADLYILSQAEIEFFFEMKSPQPNKGQCVDATRRILQHHLLRGKNRPAVQAFFALAYNPYGPTRTDYQWSIPQMYMPFDQALVIGHEFWNIVGGPNTYEELLEIYQEVGREQLKAIIDALSS